MNCMIDVRDAIVEIWSDRYLNRVDNRNEEDKNIKILQIERGSSPNNYIVQFVRLGDKKGD